MVPQAVSAFVDLVIAEFPVHRAFLEAAIAGATDDELRRLAEYLRFCQSDGRDLGYLADSYLTIVGDTLDEQEFFAEHKRYRHSTYAEVADVVYHDAEYMDRYMYGLAISTFVWPNHVEMARFFRRTFPRGRRGRYLEVGPGHGFLLLTAIELGSYDEFVGVDLSAASIAQTDSIVGHFFPDTPVRLEQRDFLAADGFAPASFDAIVMGEVLEHVEDPGRFLRRIAELAAPGAHLFVTTCVNAPAVDHIYLWRSTDELEQLITDCGLAIAEPLRLPYEGTTLAESVERALPINVAYVLGVA
jgi:2-polyprenyl-3-methyl-5-hydroxy-6-metoxy-1,4-benzoquinol methylase